MQKQAYLVQIKFEIHTCKGTLNSLLKMNVWRKHNKMALGAQVVHGVS